MIRRPLMYIASACIAAILCSYYLGMIAAFVPVLLFLAVFLRGYDNNRSLLILIAVCYVLSLFNYSLYRNTGGEAVEFAGKSAELRGKIIHVEKKTTSKGEPYIQMKLDADKINDSLLKRQSRILVKFYEEDISPLPGQQAIVKGKLELPTGKRNPNCFDYSLYLKSIGIDTIMTATLVEITASQEAQSLQGRLYVMKENFLDKMQASVGNETAALMRALMFGEKNELGEETIEEFQKNGTAHILAVSGLHIGIIYGFICMLWRWKKGKAFFALVMSFFFCYMILASFSPSVVRAVLMVGMHMFARITNRRYDLSSAAFLVVTVMLVKNPMAVFNTGLQMSFLAVLTLALMIPIVKRIYSGIFLGSAAIQLGLLPYTMYVFNYLPLGAVFINVPLIFLTGIIIPMGLCSMIAMWLPDPLFSLIAGPIFGLSEIIQYLNSVTVIDGVTVLQVTSPPLWLTVFYYLGLLMFLSEEGRLLFFRKKQKTILILLAVAIAAAVLFAQVADDGFKNADLVFVDVGQGDCMHIKTDNGMNYLIDGGGSRNYNVGKKVLKPYLLKNGVKRLDGAFITHLHTDHYQGIAELCREGMVKKLFIYEGNRVKEERILKETGIAKESLIYICQGQRIRLGGRAFADVLWPERKGQGQYTEMTEDEEDENLSSLILKVDIEGQSMIATADVDEDCQKKLTDIWRSDLKTDILKVAHHGSKYSYSQEFADMSSPRFAVFQVGKNNFGHPNEEVIGNYRNKGCKIYRNDIDGAVGFEFKEGREPGAVKMIVRQ